MIIFASSCAVRSAAVSTMNMGWVRVRRSFKEAALAAMILLRDHSSWYLDISMSRRRRHRLAASDVVTERSRAQAYTSPGPSDVWRRDVRVRELGPARDVAHVPPTLLPVVILMRRHGAPGRRIAVVALLLSR